MEIPNLPTDNLYKFMALAGLTVIIISFSLMSHFTNTIKNEKNEIELEICQLNAEKSGTEKKRLALYNELIALKCDLLRYKPDTIEKIVDLNELNRKLQNANYRDFKEFYFKYQDQLMPQERLFREISEKSKVIEDYDYNNQIKDAIIQKKSSFYSEKEDDLKRLRFIEFLSIAFGAFISAYGFLFWYFKMQKYLDKKLKKESIIK